MKLRQYVQEGIVSPTSDSPPVTPVAEFTIFARDQYGNTAVGGGDTWIVTITRPDGIRYGTANSGQSARITVADKGDGTYLASWQYNRQGSHQIAVSLEKNRKGALCGDEDGDGLVDNTCHVQYSPASSRVLRVTGAALMPPNAGSSYAYGEAVFAAQAGIPATVLVQARKLRVPTQTFDEFNRSSITGGAVFTAAAYVMAADGTPNGTAPGVEFSLVDRRDGVYELVYNAKVAGTYLFEASLDGDFIGMCLNRLGCADAEIEPFTNRVIKVRRCRLTPL